MYHTNQRVQNGGATEATVVPYAEYVKLHVAPMRIDAAQMTDRSSFLLNLDFYSYFTTIQIIVPTPLYLYLISCDN
jgi:hypothetical protein